MARILVVDDEVLVRTLLRMTLERAGHEVDVAADGTEGMRCLRENPADLVIIDLFMPKKDGIQSIIELRLNHADVKVIAISGGGRTLPFMHRKADEFLYMAKVLGADESFAKPVDREELLAAVERLVGADR